MSLIIHLHKARSDFMVFTSLKLYKKNIFIRGFKWNFVIISYYKILNTRKLPHIILSRGQQTGCIVDRNKLYHFQKALKRFLFIIISFTICFVRTTNHLCSLKSMLSKPFHEKYGSAYLKIKIGSNDPLEVTILNSARVFLGIMTLFWVKM